MNLNHLAKSSYALRRRAGKLGSSKSTSIWIIMKLILFFTFALTLQASADALGQRVSLSAKNQPLKQVLKELRKQSRYSFIYKDSDLESIKRMDVLIQEKEILDVLPLLFDDLPLTYTVNGKIISIQKKKQATPANSKIEVKQYEDPETKDWVIEGVVIEEDTGEPIEGATIELTTSKGATITDRNGRFRLIIQREGGRK